MRPSQPTEEFLMAVSTGEIPLLSKIFHVAQDLQRELCEARSYHINLHVEYTQLKNAYEKLVNVTEDEWRAVENLGLSEPIKKVISKFWKDIEFITTAFFDILELLNRKDYLEKSLLAIWRSQIVQSKDKEPSQPEEVQPSSEDGIAVVPGYLEYLNSQLIELKGRIKWVEYNLMKYKFAACHGTELKSIINNVLKGHKKQSKWQMFSRSLSKQSSKLEEEVKWYQKRLKFFREDVQRIKSVQNAIFLKYVTPEDKKNFPSSTLILENALKGNPTNYPGSWIESSRLSMNLSVQSNPSVQSDPNSLPGAFKLEIQDTSSQNQPFVNPVCKAECAVSDKTHNVVESPYKICPGPNNSNNCPSSYLENINNPSTLLRIPTSITKDSHSSISINRHSSLPEFDQRQGDITKLGMTKTHSVQDFVFRERFIVSGNIGSCEQANNVNLGTQKPEPEVKKALSNPFEDDDQVEGNADGSSNQVLKKPPNLGHSLENHGKNNSGIQSSTGSSIYESAEEPHVAGIAKTPSNIVSPQTVSSNSWVSQYSSLVSAVYVPCSIPCAGASGASDISRLSSACPIPFTNASYGLSFNSYKPEKSILKKFTSFLHKKK